MADSLPEAETCWTLVQQAARGDREAREAFVRTYLPVVQAYLVARFGGSSLRAEIDDAIQEVFLDCFRTHGALQCVERDQGSGFRGFLYGVVRNVAMRFEANARHGKPAESIEQREAADSALQDDSASRIFDRAWAQSVMRAAADRLAEASRNERRESRSAPRVPARAVLASHSADDARPAAELAVEAGESESHPDQRPHPPNEASRGPQPPVRTGVDPRP